MKSEEMHILLDKYLTGQASAKEVKLVEEWYQSFEANPGITERLNEGELERSMTESFNCIRNQLKFK